MAVRGVLARLAQTWRAPRGVADAGETTGYGDAPTVDEESAAEEEIASDISREFLWGTQTGSDPFCPRPWRMLKITLTGTTKICCDFFTQLPEFDWPTAQEFHSDDRMWNHPFMQHLRTTMGMPDEVSFCTLCLTKDKRSPEHEALRRQVEQESRELYHRIEDETFAARYRGTIAAHEPISEVSLTLPNGRELRPFPQDLTYYRRMVRMRHFAGHDRVLQIGASTPAITTFLAEANDHLTVVGDGGPRVARAADLCRSFELDPTEVSVDLAAALPFEDGAFAAVWIDGPTLHTADRGQVLAEAARVVRPGGAVLVHVAPGPGGLLARAARATGEELESLLAVLRAGTAHDGPRNLVTGGDLRRIVQRTGLKLDIAAAVGQRWLPPTIEGPVTDPEAGPELERLAAAYAVERSPGGPLGLEGSMTFVAVSPLPTPTPAHPPHDDAAVPVLLGMPSRRT